MADVTDLIGVFDRIQWRADDGSGFTIAVLRDGSTVLGNVPNEELVHGLEYQFQGRWDRHPVYGRQFKFSGFIQRKPHGKDALVTYLVRYSPPGCGVGPATARRLVDTFGESLLPTVRDNPLAVTQACPRIQFHQAEEISEIFRKHGKMEDTKISLLQLFAGRGFPRATIDAAIEKWGIDAAEVVRRNPFVLLIERFPGCGFLRTDKLYVDLGLDRMAMIRQVLCCWHVLQSDATGDTWLAASVVADKLRERISGTSVNPKAAVEKGEEDGWLATYRDGAGVLWIADAKRARNEEVVVEFIKGEQANGFP